MTSPFLVGVAVGSGLAARAAEQAGADFLLAINAGRMRNMGAPSVAGILPIADATEITFAFAPSEILSRAGIPVYVGVNVFGATADPRAIAERAAELGFDGVVNFPTAMHFPPSFQRLLERGGRGTANEVAVLAEAKALGLKTIYYSANRTQARQGADAKLDMILLNFGWNAGGKLGHTSQLSIDEAAVSAREIGRFVRRIHPEVRFLLEGGPIVTAEDLARVMELAEVDGYVGGSTIERLPLENAVGNLIASYRQVGAGRNRSGGAARRLLSWGRDLGAAGRSERLISALRDLKGLSGLHVPALISHERGSDPGWVLRAFELRARTLGVQVIRPDHEGGSAAVAQRLFGSLREGVERPGALGDGACGLVVIHGPETLTPAIQRRLARALAEGRYAAQRSRRLRPVLTRCIFVSQAMKGATLPENLDPALADVLTARVFRIPPLRDRPDDLAALIAAHFDSIGLAQNRRPELSPAALLHLQRHDWPGNDRELHAVADVIALDAGPIDQDRIARAFAGLSGEEAASLTGQTEKARVVEALWRNSFHRGRTATALGISRKTLYNKMVRFGLRG